MYYTSDLLLKFGNYFTFFSRNYKKKNNEIGALVYQIQVKWYLNLLKHFFKNYLYIDIDYKRIQREFH